MTAVGAALAVTVTGCASSPTSSEQSAGSVYRVEIEQCLGLRTLRATAFAVASPASGDPVSTSNPDRTTVARQWEAQGPGSVVLVTAAHSFERASDVAVRDERDQLRQASLAFLDQAKDIAVLQIDPTGPEDRAFSLTEPAPASSIEVVTFADIEGPAVKSGTVTRLVDATLDGEGRRRAVELAAIDIEPGDSGAPVVDQEGSAVAMVFAAARADDRAWATAAMEINDAVAIALDPATVPHRLSCAVNRSEVSDPNRPATR